MFTLFYWIGTLVGVLAIGAVGYAIFFVYSMKKRARRMEKNLGIIVDLVNKMRAHQIRRFLLIEARLRKLEGGNPGTAVQLGELTLTRVQAPATALGEIKLQKVEAA